MVFKSRYIILALFIVWIGFASAFASQIGPLTEEEEFIPKYHPNVRVWTIFGENFTRENERSENVEINLVWGTQDINREGENMWDPEFIGQIVFNEEFDLTRVES